MKNIDKKNEDEEEFVVEVEDESSSAINDNKLSISTEGRSIANIVDWVLKEKIIIPNYQRNYVWDKSKKSFFIDSLLLGFPIPSIILFMNKDKKYELIDGKQRVLTMLKYINPKIEKINGEPLDTVILNKSSKFNKKRFIDLSSDEQEDFKDNLLSLTIFKFNETNVSEFRKTKYEIFKRINTGSDKLTHQEIRNALFEGKELEMIKEFSRTETFLNLVKNNKNFVYYNEKNRKMQDEFILRLLSYKSHYFGELKDNVNFSESASKQEFINEYMLVTVEKTADFLIKELSILEYKLHMIYNFDQESFYSLMRNLSLKKVSTAIFETFAEALYIYSCGIDNFQAGKSILELKKSILENPEKYKCFFQATTNLKNVAKRVSIIKDYFDK